VEVWVMALLLSNNAHLRKKKKIKETTKRREAHNCVLE
jgi:hypothetical protein